MSRHEWGTAVQELGSRSGLARQVSAGLEQGGALAQAGAPFLFQVDGRGITHINLIWEILGSVAKCVGRQKLPHIAHQPTTSS